MHNICTVREQKSVLAVRKPLPAKLSAHKTTDLFDQRRFLIRTAVVRQPLKKSAAAFRMESFSMPRCIHL